MKARGRKIRFLLSGFLTAVLLTVGGMAYGLAAPDVLPQDQPSELPLVGTYDNLLQLLEKSQAQRLYMDGDVVLKAEESSGSAQITNAVSDFSATNVQVEGVDEADLVKTDGSYIYQVNNDRVLIIKAEPPSQMQLVAAIKFDDAGFQPTDLYLDTGNLIVIGTCYRQVNWNSPEIMLENQIYPPIRSIKSTRAIVWDIKDKGRITKVRQLEIEGSYLSSRKIGSSFYLLTNKYLNYYYIQNGEDITPSWCDSVQGDDFITEKLENIRYFPDCISPNYLMVAAMDLNSPQTPANIQTYLGSGDQVYASPYNLYIAIQNIDSPVLTGTTAGMVAPAPNYNTSIYKFELEPGGVKYFGTGKVPGNILNQFSMDENEGYFRIATTSGEIWRGNTSNNVYILDKNLQVYGTLENIAPGEKIYSTRFMGDRAYMVTFRQVDPFFVLDLKDPGKPAILGKLKIPGYSDYLQPYDENHIIGFGKNTIETKVWDGQTQAFYQGMKIAIFDVSDVNHPVEMSKALIGDRGTDSEILHNHKALLFSAEKNLLAFPVTVMEIQNPENDSDSQFPAYGTFTFQGVYIYSIDLTNGLQYRGRISHLNSEDYIKAGDVWYTNSKSINRVLYIGNTLYTLSPAMAKANDISDLTEIKTLILPGQ